MNYIKLKKGDCLELMKNIENESIDLVIIDPPYLLNSINRGGSVNNIKKMNKSLKSLEKANIIKGYEIVKVLNAIDRLQKKTNIYIFCNKNQIPLYFEYFDLKKVKFDIIIWNKNNAMPTYYNKYLTDCEYILYFREPGCCFPSNYEDAKTVFMGSINHKDKKIWNHPTIKPLNLIEKFINNSSKEGDLILDCFAGSGTTGVACQNLNRKCILIEKEDTYCKIIEQRLKENAIQKRLSVE